jgi:two-component system response regulator PilR (NtrC family)
MTKMEIHKIEEMARRRGKPFRILIVDDEPRVRDVFKEFCEITHSVEVDLAVDGLDAVSKVGKADYDLVTMDLIMPEMAGVEAVARIKEIRPYLPVIIITGNATERLINQAGVKGATSLMYKPVMLEDFVDEVIRALEKGIPVKTTV